MPTGGQRKGEGPVFSLKLEHSLLLDRLQVAVFRRHFSIIDLFS